MVSVEDAVIARISRKGVNFEILVDPDLALSMRRGAQVNIENVLAVNDILKDSRKGERHTNEDLHKSFGTTDVFAIAEIIIKEGEIQLTTEQRHKMLEDKKKQIADIISKQGLDPKSKLPHPPLRIMNAMEQAHVHVDPFKPAKEQIKIIVEKIQEVLPISLEKIELAIRVPAEYAGKANAIIRQITDVKKEEWGSSSWIAVVQIPAGMQGDIYDKLNKLTGGRVEVKMLKEYGL